MGFYRARRPAPPPARTRAPVFAVGGRVFVDCTTDRSDRVTLTDEGGHEPLATLEHGTEVVILAWRPTWAATTRYHVRATDSGLEGWLPVGELSGTKVAAPAGLPVTPPAEHVSFEGRRFGTHGSGFAKG